MCPPVPPCSARAPVLRPGSEGDRTEAFIQKQEPPCLTEGCANRLCAGMGANQLGGSVCNDPLELSVPFVETLRLGRWVCPAESGRCLLPHMS